LGDLLLAGKPDVSIVRPADCKEGLEDVAVKIALDVFLGVLGKIRDQLRE
jgi:hypothetical protein